MRYLKLFKIWFFIPALISTLLCGSLAVIADENDSGKTMEISVSLLEDLIKSTKETDQRVLDELASLRKEVESIRQSSEKTIYINVNGDEKEISTTEYKHFLRRIFRENKTDLKPLEGEELDSLKKFQAIIDRSITLTAFTNEDKSTKYDNSAHIKIDEDMYNVAKGDKNSGIRRVREIYHQKVKDRLPFLDNGKAYESLFLDVRELLILSVLYENLAYKESYFDEKATELSKKEGLEEEYEKYSRTASIYKQLSEDLIVKIRTGFELLALSAGDNAQFRKTFDARLAVIKSDKSGFLRKNVVLNRLSKIFWESMLERHENPESKVRTIDNMKGVYADGYLDALRKTGVKNWFLRNSAVAFVGAVIGNLIADMAFVPWAYSSEYVESLMNISEVITYPINTILYQWLGIDFDLDRANSGTLLSLITVSGYNIIEGIKKYRNRDQLSFLETQSKNRRLLIETFLTALDEARIKTQKAMSFSERISAKKAEYKQKMKDIKKTCLEALIRN